MGQVTINGVNVSVPDGADISVINNKIYVNGQPYGIEFDNNLVIEVIGSLVNVKTDRGCVNVTGDVTGNVDAGGSVKCGNVGGYVDSGGALTCGDVQGNVDSGGSVKCGKVGGKVDAGGSVMVLK